VQCSRCHKESLEYRHTQPFCGPLSGTTHVGWYQKKYLPTYTRPNRQTSFINVLHPPCSIYVHDSPFPQYLSPGPLCLALALTEPSTVCCIHNALLIVCVSLCVVARWLNIPPAVQEQTTRMRAHTLSAVLSTDTTFFRLLRTAWLKVESFLRRGRDVRSSCRELQEPYCAARELTVTAPRPLQSLPGAINETRLEVLQGVCYFWNSCKSPGIWNWKSPGI